MVALHPFYIQILHADATHLAVVRESIGDFVKVVFPLVRNMLLQPGYTNTGFIPVGRTAFATRQDGQDYVAGSWDCQKCARQNKRQVT